MRQSLAKRSQMAFFHSDIHTVGAGTQPVEVMRHQQFLVRFCAQDIMNLFGETAGAKMFGAAWQNLCSLLASVRLGRLLWNPD